MPSNNSSPVEIPEDVLGLAEAAYEAQARTGTGSFRLAIARAILAERERWQPAVTYFERYCQDEAEDVENCVCGEQQHEDAKAFRDIASSIRKGKNDD